MNNQEFTNPNEKSNIYRKIDRKQDSLNELFKLLATEGEDVLAIALEYQLKGANHKRQAIIDECKVYIKKVAMPQYLQADALRKAEEQISEVYVERLHSILGNLEDIELTESNVYFDDSSRQWEFTETLKNKLLNDSRHSLSDSQQEVLNHLRDIFDIAEKIDQTHNVQKLLDLYERREDVESLAFAVYIYGR